MPKNIDGLMRYLRDQKGIAIKGSAQKRKLRNMGYYHGYKGYRFIGKSANSIPYTDFNQLVAIYDFDMRLKSLLYPHLMFLETTLKNLVLEQLIQVGKSDNFNYIYANLLNDYKRFPANSDKQKEAIKKRLILRDHVYSLLTREYGNRNDIVQHFYHNDMGVPIWGIFEILTLGEFGNFFGCLNFNIRSSVSKELGLHQPSDSDAFLTMKIIFVIKELRNAVAHNNIIFDTRFSRLSVSNAVKNALNIATGISNITFSSIIDYLILVTYLLKCVGVSKTDMKGLATDFQNAIEELRTKVPFSIYAKIIPTDTRKKINELRIFVSK